MRVLITGASGFVGRHLVRECRRRDDEVIGTHWAGEDPPESDVPSVPVDVVEPDTVRAALREVRPEGIVHLAGQADVAQANRDPCGTFRVNAEGTYQLLVALRDELPDARAVIVTSSEVYGQVPAGELPVKEDRALAPRTPYGCSKAAADVCARQAAEG